MANELLAKAKKYQEFLVQEDEFNVFLENREKISLILDTPGAWEAFQIILETQEETPAKKVGRPAVSTNKAKPATKPTSSKAKAVSKKADEIELPDDIDDQVMNALDGHEKGMNLKELAAELDIELKTALKKPIGRLLKAKSIKELRPGCFRRTDVVVQRGRKKNEETSEEPAPAKAKPTLRAVTKDDEPKIDGRAKPQSLEECNARLAAKPAPPPKIKAMLKNSKKAFELAMRVPTARTAKSKALAIKAAKAYRGKGGGDKRKSPLQQAGGK